jgi:hypothetical protein
MALDSRHLVWVKRCLSENSNKRLKIASFGYPDLLVNRESLEIIFGKNFVDELKVRNDAAKIISKYDFLIEIFDTVDLFEKLGCEYDIFDIFAHQGIEEFLDLNEDIPTQMHQKYDIVLDPGTLKHCFNVGSAIKNMASMVKENGYIVHHNPLIMVNHGFYNFSPTFYFDFYAKNGFKILEFPLVDEGHLSTYWASKSELGISVCNNLLVKRLFSKRIIWPNQFDHLDNIYRKLFREFIIENEHINKVGLVPTSVISEDMLAEYRGNSVSQLVVNLYDSKLCGGSRSDILINTIESAVDDDLDKIIVTTYTYEDEIVTKLIDSGFPREKIFVINGGRFKLVNTA